MTFHPCHKCSNPGTKVFVIPDPYYGYGHDPTLCCNSCTPDNIFCDQSHNYDPDFDDFHLRFTNKSPIYFLYVFNSHNIRCHTCKNLITTEKRGSGHVYNSPQSIDPNLDYFEVYFCQPCFRFRNGNGRVNLDSLPYNLRSKLCEPTYTK